MAATERREREKTSSRDEFVVPAAPVSGLIGEFLGLWQIRPRSDCSAFNWLSEKSGVPVPTIKQIRHRGERTSEYPTAAVDFSTADAIVAAVDRAHDVYYVDFDVKLRDERTGFVTETRTFPPLEPMPRGSLTG